MSKRKQEGWGITYVNSPRVAIHSIRRTRREAIDDWVGDSSNGWDWARWKEHGCKSVKVTVTQDQP